MPRFAMLWAEESPEQRWREVDGSLLLADISGFTALSERLARHGRHGAEELTDRLGHCFAELLAVGYAADGSLLKFGGDALLLFFDGDDHPRRAALSAARMRATMADVGRVSTSVGTTRLRMSIGVHSGPLHFFRVGSSHHELIPSGPGVTTIVDMESAADAGEIVVSPSTAAHLERKAVGAPKGSGVLLRTRTFDPHDGWFPPPHTPTVDLATLIPAALREELTFGTAESEHRSVTTAFIHFDGVDGLISSAGPDAAADALQDLVATVQEAADGQGVTFLATDVDRDGGKIILVAGAPRSLGDGDDRMLRTLRHIVDRRPALPVRIGVNRGPVFAGAVGPPYRRTYTVMGDAVNLTARLMAHATAGQILSTAGVLDHAGTEYVTESVAPFTVKGKTDAVRAFAVGARLSRRDDGRADELPFTGREAELCTLVGALDAARGGRGSLVEITGPSGIGKSRLVDALTEQAESTKVVRVYCDLFESQTPYFPFRFLLRGILGVAAGEAEELRDRVAERAPSLLPWLPLLAAVTGIDVPTTAETEALEAEFRRQRTRWAVVELLTAAITEPTILVIDDGQWLDALSAELLTDVASMARDRPWLVVLVDHETPAGYGSAETGVHLPLLPLDDVAASTIVMSVTAGAPLVPHVLDGLVQRAGGNPLFLQELLRSPESRHGGAALPESLEGVVATEIDRLTPDDRRLLRYLSVLGATFETSLVTEMVNCDAGAVRRRLRWFLEPVGPGVLRFRNQCHRQVAYDTLPFGRRRELHARAAALIERSRTDSPGVLSLHFLHAQEYDRCWYHARVAGAEAEARYANVEAAELYERAITASRHLADVEREELAATWESLGDVCDRSGAYDRALLAFRRARHLRTGDVIAVASLSIKEAYSAKSLGRQSGAVRWLRRALRIIDGVTTQEGVSCRAELGLVLAQVRMDAGNYRDAIRWCELTIGDAERSDNQSALAGACTVLDTCLVALGRIEEATHSALAVTILEQLGRVHRLGSVLTFLAGLEYYQGRWDEAVRLWERGTDAYERAGDLVSAAYGTCNIGEVQVLQGLGDDVALDRALRLFVSFRDPVGVAGVLLNQGRLVLREGDLPRAVELFEKAKATTPGAAVEADTWLAECALRAGDTAHALDLLATAGRAEQAGGDTTYLSMIHRLRGCAYVALGRDADARSEFDAALDVSRARGGSYDIALALEAVAVLAMRSGQPIDEAAEIERAELLASLGVISTPPPPLPDGRAVAAAF
ncbi:MAG: adenylate/guanylate cyclase domain-containing protein [Acidimicrobiales bacterium]